MIFDKTLATRIIGPVLVTGALAWQFGWGWGPALALAAIVIGAEIVRTRNSARVRQRYLLRGRQPPNEHSFEFRARAESAVVLWSVEIGSLALAAAGVLVLVVAPEKWLAALAGIGFFGACAALFTYLLVLRRRAGVSRP